MVNTNSDKKYILFVCTANFCRSPMAEGVFTNLIKARKLENKYIIDSAGITNNFAGRSPDRRAQAKCIEHGIDISYQKSRQIEEYDFEIYEYIIGMDFYNIENLRAIAPKKYKNNIELLLSYIPDCGVKEVPDPYYNRENGFDIVYNLINNACVELLKNLEND